MTIHDTDVSIPTAVAIALGAMKATDLAKQALQDVGLGNVPAQVKQLLATSVAAGLSVAFEQGKRRKIMTALTSAGLASMLHTYDRMVRARGDVDRTVFTANARSLGLGRGGR